MTTILVVDNSYVNIELLQSTFEPFGYEVITAQTVREALSLVRETRLDLILSDLHMPEEDGFDFIRAVKADPALCSIPFIFLSSTVWPEKDRVDGLRLGADKFLTRPIEPQELLQEVESCLNLR